MAIPYFRVNGVNILPFIAEKGLEWTENDIDAPDSGRTLDGLMHRGKVCEKRKVSITCWPLNPVESQIVLNSLTPQYVQVETNIDPKYGDTVMTMYNSSRPATCLIIDEKGNPKWDGIKFNLIER